MELIVWIVLGVICVVVFVIMIKWLIAQDKLASEGALSEDTEVDPMDDKDGDELIEKTKSD